MSKKPPAKGAGAPGPVSGAAPKKNALLITLSLAAMAVGAFLLWRGSAGPAPSASAAATGSAQTTDAVPASSAATPTAEVVAAVRRMAAIGPHQQAKLPPVPFSAYAPPRPPQVVADAYKFAAEHPEVASYVPCFCGCGKSGHRGNEDCFVRSRAQNGDVMEWEPHGVECAVCLDIATKSRQMHSSGASVASIRNAVDTEFAKLASTSTATPKPE